MHTALSLAFDSKGLERFLSSALPDFRGPLTARQFPHGQSNPTYLVQSRSGRYVLRRKPPGVLLPSAHAVDREFRVMRALRATAVPVPQMLCYCEDETVIGTPFYVMEYVEGRIFKDVALPELSAAERGAIYD